MTIYTASTGNRKEPAFDRGSKRLVPLKIISTFYLVCGSLLILLHPFNTNDCETKGHRSMILMAMVIPGVFGGMAVMTKKPIYVLLYVCTINPLMLAFRYLSAKLAFLKDKEPSESDGCFYGWLCNRNGELNDLGLFVYSLRVLIPGLEVCFYNWAGKMAYDYLCERQSDLKPMKSATKQQPKSQILPLYVEPAWVPQPQFLEKMSEV
ncbi:unnamed protein product, partial [Mesorhabditis spiculigera]